MIKKYHNKQYFNISVAAGGSPVGVVEGEFYSFRFSFFTVYRELTVRGVWCGGGEGKYCQKLQQMVTSVNKASLNKCINDFNGT